MKPFSTYPEDRAKLLALCDKVEKAHGSEFEDTVYALADLVRAILTDEAIVIASLPSPTPEGLAADRDGA